MQFYAPWPTKRFIESCRPEPDCSMIQRLNVIPEDVAGARAERVHDCNQCTTPANTRPAAKHGEEDSVCHCKLSNKGLYIICKQWCLVIRNSSVYREKQLNVLPLFTTICITGLSLSQLPAANCFQGNKTFFPHSQFFYCIRTFPILVNIDISKIWVCKLPKSLLTCQRANAHHWILV